MSPHPRCHIFCLSNDDTSPKSNNNYDNLCGAVTWQYRYKGTSQTTKWGKP